MSDPRSFSRREVIQMFGMSLAVSALGAEAVAHADIPATFPVTIRVDAAHSLGELTPIWRFFGADEPNYSTMKNGAKLMGELGDLKRKHVYFRTHNLLTSGDGTPALKWGSTNAYTEDAAGNAVYDWTIVDHIFDTGLQRGVKPYVQIGFMPEAMSTHPEPYRHHWTPAAKYDEIYTGWAYPPKDYGKWGELVFRWTKHCVEKYGRAEVESWYWEVWNEPNIGYWRGTFEEYCKLYDYAVDGVRRALPTARVGGPEVAGGAGGDFLRKFLEHCAGGTNYATGKTGSPLDFLAFHAKGYPGFTDSHVRMGLSHEFNDIDGAFAVIASFPEYKGTPIVIGEADPDGCAACQGPQLGYRNGTLYSSYTAAAFARMHDLAAKHGVNLQGAVTWAFTFEDVPYFAGFRQLATNGIDLPVLNVFRMMSKMSGDRVAVESSADAGLEEMRKHGVRITPDVSALASRAGDRLAVLVWHYHDDDVPGAPASVELRLRSLPWGDGPVTLQHYRVDERHSNAYTLWKELGSPQQPTPAQYALLEKAGQLAALHDPRFVSVENGRLEARFDLPRQGVSLLIFERKPL
ncbi:MAG: beta-xylosidase [Capsulimonas sp.]|uniref:GH39 family glycosyl hydrolase n=1 Tax=Capsulimonas sp. TaxID=2494211 RepID=UPI003264A4A8